MRGIRFLTPLGLAVLVGLAALAALAAPRARADSWLPFSDFRAVSPDGGTYAVIRQEEEGEGVTYEVRRRGPGREPLGPATAEDRHGMREGEGGPIDADPEDLLLMRGRFPQVPLEVRVLDGGGGLLFIEKYAQVGMGISLAYVNADGEDAWRHRLADLFDTEMLSGFRKSVSSIWWKEAVLVDDARRKALVVATGDVLREVDLRRGAVTSAPPQALLRHLDVGPEAERVLAFEIAARVQPEGLAERATRALQDAAASSALRAAAARALGATGAPDALVPLTRALERAEPGSPEAAAIEEALDAVEQAIRSASPGPLDDPADTSTR